MAYVSELDSYIQKGIEKELKKAIIETGFYPDEEIKEYVEYGMNSKVSDLEDTIDIYEVIKEKECELEEMGKLSKKKATKIFPYINPNEEELYKDVKYIYDTNEKYRNKGDGNVKKVVAYQVDGKPMEFIGKEGEQNLKVIRNKREMLEKIGDWATVHIQCDYELGASEMVATYDGESIKYEDENILNVAWFASQCNGITQDQYKDLFDKVNNQLKQNSASVEVVGDSEYGEKPYEISEMVSNFSKETIVYGYDEQNALDNYGEYLEDLGSIENDVISSEEGNFYFANGYLPIDLDNIHMKEVDESYVNEIRKNSKQLQNDKEVSMEI